MINFYRTYIAEGKAFVVFSIVASILLRSQLLLDFETESPATADNSGGYLWELLFSNLHMQGTVATVLGNSFVTLAVCLVLSFASWHYSLIREKTFLPFAISLLVFSSQQRFLLFSPYVIAALLCLTAICLLFRLYQNPRAQRGVFTIGTVLGLSLLFSTQTLPYLSLVLIALAYLRIFNLKNILSLLLGLLFILWIGLLTSIPTGHLHVFIDYLGQLNNIHFLHILDFSVAEWILSALYVSMLGIVTVNFQFNIHKDKIRIRSLINFLLLLSFIFYLSYCCLCWDPNFALYLSLGTFVIPVSHYFALTYSKFKIIFFYLLIVLFSGLILGQSQLF